MRTQTVVVLSKSPSKTIFEWSRIQSWGNINLFYRDFAQNGELRHTPRKLQYKGYTVNCKHYMTKLLASGCRLACFFW